MSSDVTAGDPAADGTEGRGDSQQGQGRGGKQRTRGPCETVGRACSRCSDRPAGARRGGDAPDTDSSAPSVDAHRDESLRTGPRESKQGRRAKTG